MARRSKTAKPTRPGVFAELQVHIDARIQRGEPIIPLHIGDTYLAPPEGAFIDRQVVVASDYAYGPTAGLRPLRAAIAEKLGRVKGAPPVDPDHEVLVGTGGTHAFFCVASALLGEGDEVILAAPYWPLTPGVFSSVGAVTREVSITTRWLRGESFDLADALATALTPKTRAIYFASPNNPDGKVWSASDLERLAAFAEEHDLWIFADEVYADLVYEGAHVSMRTIGGGRLHDRLIVIHSLSKSYALAGLRIGYVVAPRAVIEAARRISVHTSFNVPTLLQRSAIAALQTGDAWLEKARTTYASAREVVRSELEREGIRAVSGEGATYFFVDATDALRGRPLGVLLERALAEGVLITPGEASGAEYTAWARICFTACPPESLKEGIRSLARAFRALE